MKKFLIRGGLSPFDNFSPLQVLSQNAIGDNVGNLLYAYGCFRTLFSEDTSLELDYYKGEQGYSQKQIDEINESYDGYLIPLADAFRPDFRTKLTIYTSLIRRLKIPVYLLGVGLRAPYEPNLQESFPFDAEVRDFIKAVLEHSAIVGLRGQITGDYLKKLGFREEKDYTVIGCPSMYSRGRALPELRKDSLEKDSRISINFSAVTPDPVMEMLLANLKKYPNHCFTGQNIQDLRLLYTGIPHSNDHNALYPAALSHQLYQEDRVRFFVNVPSWFSHMKTIDFTIGGRLHGNVAGVLCGCAPLFIMQDARMRELAEYHHFPRIPAQDIKPEDDFQELLAKVDLCSHLRQQAANFDHFLWFLEQNGLEHIYQDDPSRRQAPLDLEMEKRTYEPAVSSVIACGPAEGLSRCQSYAADLKSQRDTLKNRNQALRQETRKLQGRLQETQQKLQVCEKKLKQCQNEKRELQDRIHHPTRMARYYAKAAVRRLHK